MISLAIFPRIAANCIGIQPLQWIEPGCVSSPFVEKQ